MFRFTYAPGTTIQQMIGFEIAGRVWDAYLNDSVTINLHVGMASSSTLPDKVIGGALPGMRAYESYSGLYDRLSADRKSTDDFTAVSNLRWGTDSVFFDQWIDGNYIPSVWSNYTSNLTRANAKALGYSFTDASALDGYIMFSDLAGAPVTWNYDYTRSTAAGSNTLDFLTTVIHEIGHVLGFVSGIDRPGWLFNSLSSTSSTTLVQFSNSLSDRTMMSTPLDLFRYSSMSYNSSAGSIRDMSYGSWNGTKYFSIDKGATSLGSFSTGADTSLGGDGQQASHWKSGGMMAPTLAKGARPWLTNLDLRALDVTGWDVNLNPTISLSTLRSQAVSALATRAGQTTTWINNNLNTSPTSLVVNRTTDVNTMLTNSQIYNWGSEGGDGAWQKIFALMTFRGLFSSVDELGDAVTIDPSEMAGQVITQVDLQALLDKQGQKSTAQFRSASPISVELMESITAIDRAPISFDRAPISLSTPSLNLEFQSLDASKAWNFSDKQRLKSVAELQPASETAKKSFGIASSIDE